MRRRHVPPVRLAALLSVLLAGCGQTGMLLEVGANAAMTGVSQLELIIAHQTQCERWIDETSPHLRVSVDGRNLQKSPYALMIHPSHFTDFEAPIFALALAYDANGQLIGGASFDSHRFVKGSIEKFHADLALRGASPDGPKYVTDDGCVCLPGDPWIGTGTGTGCDPLVVTSFARYADTAGCELPAGHLQPTTQVCDGQSYDEPTDRDLPCFARRTVNGQKTCRAHVRVCRDRDNVAYGDTCDAADNDPVLPSDTLCAAYLACEQQPCNDLMACMRATVLSPATFTCTLRVDPTTQAGKAIRPCALGGPWQTPLEPTATGAGCVATVIEGQQSVLTAGFLETSGTGPATVQTIATRCPPTFTVDKIDVNSPAEVPESFDLDVTLGDHLAHVKIDVVRACDGPSLTCKAN